MDKLLVEFLGTMIATIVALKTGNWLAIGATFAVLIYLGGPISGGSFNPAISFALWASKKLSRDDLLSYCLVEILGALLGAYAAKFIR